MGKGSLTDHLTPHPLYPTLSHHYSPLFHDRIQHRDRFVPNRWLHRFRILATWYEAIMCPFLHLRRLTFPLPPSSQARRGTSTCYHGSSAFSSYLALFGLERRLIRVTSGLLATVLILVSGTGTMTMSELGPFTPL